MQHKMTQLMGYIEPGSSSYRAVDVHADKSALEQWRPEEKAILLFRRDVQHSHRNSGILNAEYDVPDRRTAQPPLAAQFARAVLDHRR